MYFVWSEASVIPVNDILKLNYEINTCLINLNIILYHALSLNIYEYLKS